VPPAKTFPLHDRALGGRLGPLLRRYKADGLSWDEIRNRLRDDHGIDVSARTVGRWLADLERAAS
jgi:hypothetical protein